MAYILQTLISFFVWFFWDVPKKIFSIWGNLLKFGIDFFSFPLLLKTLFAPWRRYKWEYGRGFDFERFIEVFSSNLISRLLGFFIRLTTIIVGILVELLFLTVGPVLLAGWFLTPVLIFKLFELGLKMINL